MYPLRSSIPAAIALLALGALACGGPAAPAELPRTRADYNEALVRSSNEQLLRNLVRLRYLHTPQFLEVTAVASQSSVVQRTNASLGTNLGHNLRTSEVRGAFVVPGVGHGVTVTRRPTVSFVPLAGEAFSRRLVRPIRPEVLFSLVSLGWRVDRLFACCVARANDVAAPVIASSDPRFGGERFRRLGEVLYRLQERGALRVDRAEDGALRLGLGPAEGPHAELAAEARRLLGVAPGSTRLRVLPFHPRDADEDADDVIVLRGRSLLGALFYLSHGVEAPHDARGMRSLDYDGPDGPVAVEDPVPGALLPIRVSVERPPDAYAATFYRARWYSIADADLEAKQTFLLLRVLFSALSTDEG